MDYYVLTLYALKKLLGMGGNSWEKWIDQDILDYDTKKSVEHHMKAFSGMGGFNDVVICTMNGNTINKESEIWVNDIFAGLKALSYHLARKINDNQTIVLDEILQDFGHTKKQIIGCRCRNCGYGILSRNDIDTFVAPKLLTSLIKEGLKNGDLMTAVVRCYSLEIPGIKEERKKVEQIIEKSEVELVDFDVFMRPCIKCGSDDTTVYRWEIKENNRILVKKLILTPSKDNLLLRKK